MSTFEATSAHHVRACLQAKPDWAAALGLLAARKVRAYAVGGVVRDALLNRASYDLDLTIDGAAIAAARALADHLGGAVFVLDAERDVARVLLSANEGPRQIDVAGLRAQDITADLRARDFTVNALALSVSPWGERLLDPTGGLDDLARGIVRQTFDGALRDDPVRLLRLVRLQGLLGFAVDAETERAARAAAPLLAQVAPERVRDEVFNILALDDPVAGWRAVADLGLLATVCGHEPTALHWERALQTLDGLARWQSALHHDDQGTPLTAFGLALADHWRQGYTAGRSLGLLARLATLVSGCALQRRDRDLWLRGLRLSGRESAHIRGVLAGSDMLAQGQATDDLGLHRYYRTCGAAGVDGAIVWLAQATAVGEAGPALSIVERTLETWFERRATVVNPPALLSGDDLMSSLRLEAGPKVGALLAAVREAQVLGTVRTYDQALALAARLAVEGDGA